MNIGGRARVIPRGLAIIIVYIVLFFGVGLAILFSDPAIERAVS
jgi:hypothetical protein